MTPSQFQKLRSAFGRIVEKPPAGLGVDPLHSEFPASLTLQRRLDELVGNYRTDDPLFDWAVGSPGNVPPAPLFHEGQILASRFRVVRFLGRGGMGEVYEALDTTLRDRPVAIKTISGEIRHNPDAARRFHREVELAQRVTHPNICRIHDVYKHACPDPATGGEYLTHFLSMQLLVGESLAGYLAERGPLSTPEALHLLGQLAAALAAAHSAGVIHRDFKPANVILIDNRGSLRPVITDFGVAVLDDRSLDAEGDQRFGPYTGAGTPGYAAPEQKDHGRVTAAVDTYALGVVALEMLTGQTRDLSVKGLNSIQRAAIARCQSSDPSNRFAGPSEFVRALAGDPLPMQGANRILSRRTLFGVFASSAAALGAVLVTRKQFFAPSNISSLSILPFEGDKGVSPLPGFQEELIRVFLKSRKLRIIAAYSTASLVPPFNYQQLSSLLPADAFLTGVLTSTDVLVKLVRKSGSLLWQQKFDRSRPTYDLHREIQTAVVGFVDAGESDTLLQSSYLPTQDAYLAYINARSFLTRQSEGDIKQAELFFREAIHHDGDFANAWAGLSYTLQVAPKMTEARVAADRALALDDKCAEAYLVKGLVLQRGDWNWNGAVSAFGKALELETYNAHAHQWFGGILSDLGQPERAIPELNTAVDLDPISFNARMALGIGLLYSRDYDAAIGQLNQGISMARESRAETGRPYPYLGACWLMKGEKEKALQYYRHAVSIQPADVIVSCHYVFGAGMAGHLAEARAALDRLLESPDADSLPFHLAVAHLGVGERNRALEYLEHAVAVRDSEVVTLKSNIYMDPLRSDPRYRVLVDKMGLS